MIEHRGYLIRERSQLRSGTERIARPDGSRRFSPPTIVGTWSEWIVLKKLELGVFEMVGVASSESEARKMIDDVLGHN